MSICNPLRGVDSDAYFSSTSDQYRVSVITLDGVDDCGGNYVGGRIGEGGDGRTQWDL